MAATPGPSALVPLTRTFIQDSQTTAIALVGQVLDNGETNFVGYNDGGALYLLTSSADGAMETTLGDGQQYFYTSGPAPSGYTATDGGSGGGATMSGDDDEDEDMSATTGSGMTSGAGTMSRPTATSSRTTGSNSGSQTSAAGTSETSQGNAGQQLSTKGVIGLAMGFLSVFGLYAL